MTNTDMGHVAESSLLNHWTMAAATHCSTKPDLSLSLSVLTAIFQVNLG